MRITLEQSTYSGKKINVRGSAKSHAFVEKGVILWNDIRNNNLSVSMIRAAVCKSWPRPVGPIVFIKIMETLRYEANRSIIERK